MIEPELDPRMRYVRWPSWHHIEQLNFLRASVPRQEIIVVLIYKDCGIPFGAGQTDPKHIVYVSPTPGCTPLTMRAMTGIAFKPDSKHIAWFQLELISFCFIEFLETNLYYCQAKVPL